MSRWIQNLSAVLHDKPVVLLHGNVRDRYIDDNGKVFENLTALLTHLARQSPISFNEVVLYDPAGLERSITLNERPSTQPASPTNDEFAETQPTDTTVRQQETPARTLARWARELRDPQQSRLAVTFYLDKIISYRTSYTDDERECLLWLEKAIENISNPNRLVLVALRDSMVPVELYLQSPKCRVLSIPMPDKADRLRFLTNELPRHEHLELIADLTDGLYLLEVHHIARTLRKTTANDTREIQRIVNHYRIGQQEDYWGNLSLQKLDNAFEWFTQVEGVKGQDEAVNSVLNLLTLARSGLSGMASGTPSKPKGALFFAGPTGVGKTFVAKKLAKFLFTTEEAFVRFDMSEFKEEHTVSKLIGSPPGYVGYEQGGMLTNAVRERPFAVVLFDEIEKAHPRIMDIFLQLIDEGRLTDSRGQTIFFTETVIIFTSNIGCRATDGRGNSISERNELDSILADACTSVEAKQKQIRAHFIRSVEQFLLLEISRPELLNRIGSHVIPFNYIDDRNTQCEIVASHLSRIKSDFEDKYRQNGYRLIVADDVPNFLVKVHGQKMAEFGGRGIVDALNQRIMTGLARSVLQAEYDGRSGIEFHITLDGNELMVDF